MLLTGFRTNGKKGNLLRPANCEQQRDQKSSRGASQSTIRALPDQNYARIVEPEQPAIYDDSCTQRFESRRAIKQLAGLRRNSLESHVSQQSRFEDMFRAQLLVSIEFAPSAPYDEEVIDGTSNVHDPELILEVERVTAHEGFSGPNCVRNKNPEDLAQKVL